MNSKMGTFGDGNRRWESLGRESLHHAASLEVWKLWKTGRLWIPRLFLLLAVRGEGLASHIKWQLSTGLSRASVGTVGKYGYLSAVITVISKSPHLHSRVMENFHQGQITEPR